MHQQNLLRSLLFSFSYLILTRNPDIFGSLVGYYSAIHQAKVISLIAEIGVADLRYESEDDTVRSLV